MKKITHKGGMAGDWSIIEFAQDKGFSISTTSQNDRAVTRYTYESILYLENLGYEVVDENNELLLPYYKEWLNIKK